MRREFLVERQGRQFVLYSGLLALGHEQGLKSIRTQLIQIPTEDNKRVAIVSATVVLEKDGVEREFHGLGDASPANVATAMVHCLIRLAETRAKARALRDAVNVGMAALEELGDDDVYEGAPERGYTHQGNGNQRGRALASRVQANQPRVQPAAVATVAAPRTPAPLKVTEEKRDPALITEAQMDAIRSLCRRRQYDVDQMTNDRFGKPLGEITMEQGQKMIRDLQQRAA